MAAEGMNLDRRAAESGGASVMGVPVHGLISAMLIAFTLGFVNAVSAATNSDEFASHKRCAKLYRRRSLLTLRCILGRR
jgi:hypothetical protein